MKCRIAAARSVQFLAAAMMTLAIGACEPGRPSPPPDFTPVPLIEPLASGMALAEVSAQLGGNRERWRVTNDEALDLPGHDRPIRSTRVEVANYDSLGISGTLILRFMDDMLVRTSFYPSDLEAYLARLKSQDSVDLLATSPAFTKNGAHVWVYLLEPGDEFVGWRDDTLSDRYTLYN